MSLKNVSKLRITDLEEINLQDLKHNENLILMGMRTLEDGYVLSGSTGPKYICLAENKRHHKSGTQIQIFSFNETVGVQNLKRGQAIKIKGKLNSYKGSSGKTFYSIYVEKLEENIR